jgi:hypothetical protein
MHLVCLEAAGIRGEEEEWAKREREENEKSEKLEEISSH